MQKKKEREKNGGAHTRRHIHRCSVMCTGPMYEDIAEYSTLTDSKEK